MVKQWMAARLLAGNVSGCGYNTRQRQNEEEKKKRSEKVKQHQRRADMMPNLVATVQG